MSTQDTNTLSPDTPPADRHHKPAPAARDRAAVEALPDALRKMRPLELRQHPVMLVVEVGAVVTTLATIVDPSVFASWSRCGCG